MTGNPYPNSGAIDNHRSSILTNGIMMFKRSNFSYPVHSCRYILHVQPINYLFIFAMQTYDMQTYFSSMQNCRKIHVVLFLLLRHFGGAFKCIRSYQSCGHVYHEVSHNFAEQFSNVPSIYNCSGGCRRCARYIRESFC